MPGRRTAEIVAIILAIGIASALNVMTIAMLYEAIFHTESAGLSENATQIMTGWGGGMIGVLGAFVGYAFGREVRAKESAVDEPKREEVTE